LPEPADVADWDTRVLDQVVGENAVGAALQVYPLVSPARLPIQVELDPAPGSAVVDEAYVRRAGNGS
jgi:hypothetical protein